MEQVEDANDLDSLSGAIEAGMAEEDRPSLIDVRSIIGWPSPNMQGTAKTHGAALGEDEVRATKEVLGWDPDKTFQVPDGVYDHYRDAVAPGAKRQSEWDDRLAAWQKAEPGAAAEWDRAWEGRPLNGLAEALPSFHPAEKDSLATRVASGKAIQALAPFVPTMIGGSADLAGSTNTDFDDAQSFTREHAGRNVHWGVREHAMGSATNGMALHGGIVRPFGSTFLQFSDYMRGAVRLSALMRLPVAWVYTHDSVGLGEDGPTHQPVEHFAALRAIPNLTVIRPGDPAEAVEAWRVTLEEVEGPVAMLLTRQGIPVLDRSKLAGAEGLARGAYVLSEAGEDPAQAVIVATGSEVAVALDAQEQLRGEGIAARVVSMPSWELFDAQPPGYAESVLPAGVPVVSVEAGVSQGWERFADRMVSIERFGASAPGAEVLSRLGITPDAVADAVRQLL